MTRTKRKKIYYIPGIISLAILPFVFIYFASNEIKSNSLKTITIFVWDDNMLKKYPGLLINFNGNFPPKRNYLDIVLTGNNQEDKIKLDFAQIRIREILSKNDSVKGLHFNFGDSSQYWTFIKSLDNLASEGAKTFGPSDNDLWFYHFPPDTTIIPLEIGNDVITLKPRKSVGKSSKFTKHIWETSWELILGFTVFLFSIFILKNSNTSSHGNIN